MVHKEMHRWICDYVFREYMNSTRNEMAIQLRISERMLDRAITREDSPEARLVFELCMRYCIDHDIDLNDVFRNYFLEEE